MPAELTFADKLRAVPFLRALVPMVAGIVAGAFLDVPFYVWAGSMAICAAAAVGVIFFGRQNSKFKSRVATLYVALAILFFGAAISRANNVQSTHNQKHTPRETIFTRMQTGATERLYRLADGESADGGKIGGAKCFGPDELAVAAAMTTGDRAGITRELRRAYSRTGAAHLLAVSGLHVGIVFLIINVLLYLLPLFRGGHAAKNVVAVAAIWLYAAMTGLSPSAERAAFMFTGAQVALAMSAARSATNIMCAAAFLMLAVRPAMLFNLSFQLSFLAVAGIMAWFRPLYALVESRWRALNALWSVLIVGLAASLATMPLVSHTFGTFSPAGVVLNPIVIATAHLVVGFSLLWIIAPIGFLEPVFRWLVGGPAWLQNRVVELSGAVPGMAIEWRMPLWAMFAVYAAMLGFTVWLASRPRKTEPFRVV